MEIFHDREIAKKQMALELRVIKLPDGVEHAIHLEKYVWDEYDFITGQVYGHVYHSDQKMFEWAEQSAVEMNRSLNYALDQIVRYTSHVLTGKALPKFTVIE